LAWRRARARSAPSALLGDCSSGHGSTLVWARRHARAVRRARRRKACSRAVSAARTTTRWHGRGGKHAPGNRVGFGAHRRVQAWQRMLEGHAHAALLHLPYCWPPRRGRSCATSSCLQQAARGSVGLRLGLHADADGRHKRRGIRPGCTMGLEYQGTPDPRYTQAGATASRAGGAG